MSVDNNPTAAEYRALQVSLLQKMDGKLDDVVEKLVALTVRMTKLESTDQAANVKDLSEVINAHDIRLTKIETRSIIQNSVVAFVVSVIMGAISLVLQIFPRS